MLEMVLSSILVVGLIQRSRIISFPAANVASNKRFETTGYGVTVFGTTESQQLNVSGVSTFQGNVDLGDGDRLRLGDGQDLQIYHGGLNGIIENTTGSLFIRDNGNNVFIQGIGGENSGIFRADGAVELYHDASKKFETTSTGIDVTGHTETDTLNVSGISTFQDDVSIADKIIHTGDTDTAIRFPANNTFAVETGGSERLRVASNGRVGIGTVPNNNTTLDIRGAGSISNQIKCSLQMLHILI